MLETKKWHLGDRFWWHRFFIRCILTRALCTNIPKLKESVIKLWKMSPAFSHQHINIVIVALILIESIVVQTWFSFVSKEKWFYEYQPYKIWFIHLNFGKIDCLADEVCVGGEQRGFGRPGWICSSILSRLIVANLSGFIAPPCGCFPVCLRNAFESNAVACWFKWWCVELIFGFHSRQIILFILYELHNIKMKTDLGRLYCLIATGFLACFSVKFVISVLMCFVSGLSALNWCFWAIIRSLSESSDEIRKSGYPCPSCPGRFWILCLVTFLGANGVDETDCREQKS